MAKSGLTMIKLQVPAGQANPAPPVGPALGQHGINIMDFCKTFNEQTKEKMGTIIPVEITVFEDRSFTFITKTPPAAILLKQAARIDKGSGEPNKEKVGQVSENDLRQIAEISDGNFFRASDNESLEKIFKIIDTYEKVEIKESRYKETTDYYQYYLLWSIIIFTFWILIKSSFINNSLID